MSPSFTLSVCRLTVVETPREFNKSPISGQIKDNEKLSKSKWNAPVLLSDLTVHAHVCVWVTDAAGHSQCYQGCDDNRMSKLMTQCSCNSTQIHEDTQTQTLTLYSSQISGLILIISRCQSQPNCWLIQIMSNVFRVKFTYFDKKWDRRGVSTQWFTIYQPSRAKHFL